MLTNIESAPKHTPNFSFRMPTVYRQRLAQLSKATGRTATNIILDGLDEILRTQHPDGAPGYWKNTGNGIRVPR